jgi:hypothetical protein
MQILPNAKSQFIDQNGLPLASGTVGFYFPGTLNPKPTYQDAAGTIANTNPVTLDSRGQALIWGSGVYRQIVKDASGVTIWDQVTEDANSGLIGNITDAKFVSGTDFTPGVTTSLTLPVAPGAIANTWIHFDAALSGRRPDCIAGWNCTDVHEPDPCWRAGSQRKDRNDDCHRNARSRYDHGFFGCIQCSNQRLEAVIPSNRRGRCSKNGSFEGAGYPVRARFRR